MPTKISGRGRSETPQAHQSRGQLSLESLVVIAIVILVSAAGYSTFSAINRNFDGQKGLFLAMSQAESAAMVLGEAANFGEPFDISGNMTKGVERISNHKLIVIVDGIEGEAPIVNIPDSRTIGEFKSYEQ